MESKTVFMIGLSDMKIDKHRESTYIYTPSISYSLLRAVRCVKMIIEESITPDSIVTRQKSGPFSSKQLMENLRKSNSLANFPIAEWTITGLNEKTKNFYDGDEKKISITAFKIK